LPLHHHNFALNFPGDLGGTLPHQNVDFAAHAEFGKIYARLNREAAIGKDLADVVYFEVVHIGAVGVDIGTDGVAGAVDEVFAKALAVDVVAGSAVDFPTGN